MDCQTLLVFLQEFLVLLPLATFFRKVRKLKNQKFFSSDALKVVSFCYSKQDNYELRSDGQVEKDTSL